MWEWERRGRIDEDPEQVCISLMVVPCSACREFSGGNGGMEHVDRKARGQCQLVGWELQDRIGNDYIKCIVVTFANRS